jgi:hypothetical protein
VIRDDSGFGIGDSGFVMSDAGSGISDKGYLDTSAWSGEGALTQQLIAVIQALPQVRFLRVDDAPASRADAGFSFISNELFVGFWKRRRVTRTVRLGVVPWWRVSVEPDMTLAGLEAHFASVEGIGAADYADPGMLQFLRTERVIPAYQTRGYKLVELVRIYEAGTAPRRDP